MLALVISRFNIEITQALYEGALLRLQEKGIPSSFWTETWVPGAFEIPLLAQALAKTKRYQAIVALGAVIRGETDHYHYVCEQVSQGCMRIALDQELPVIFGVLTTDNEAQAWDRLGGTMGHKGREAIDAAYSTLHALAEVRA